MKKSTCLTILLLAFSLISFSQIQRSVKQKPKKDSIINQMQGEKVNRKDMMKKLDLTRLQKGKMKEAMQDIKAQKKSLDADTTLTSTARQQKNRELRKMQLEKMNSILNQEQKEKLKKLRLDKKELKKDGPDEDMDMQLP